MPRNEFAQILVFSSMTPILPIDAITALCKQHGVRELLLFGSAGRSEFNPETSDYDFLVEFLDESRISLFDHFDLQINLEALLHRKVDLVSKRGLKSWVRQSVLDDSRSVYHAND